MFNTKPTQLELFNSGADSLASKKNAQGSFFEKINVYEKNIILVVLFIILFIIAYSLGIEKGKKIVTLGSFNLTQENLKTISAPLSVKTDNLKAPAAENTKKALINNAPDYIHEATKKGYAVQVASFKKETSAQKEKLTLEKKGYNVIVLPKKDFLVVYTGIFKNEAEAKTNQKELRKYYNDCIVRKI